MVRWKTHLAVKALVAASAIASFAVAAAAGLRWG